MGHNVWEICQPHGSSEKSDSGGISKHFSFPKLNRYVDKSKPNRKSILKTHKNNSEKIGIIDRLHTNDVIDLQLSTTNLVKNMWNIPKSVAKNKPSTENVGHYQLPMPLITWRLEKETKIKPSTTKNSVISTVPQCYQIFWRRVMDYYCLL